MKTELKCPVCNSYLHKIPVKESWTCSTHDSKDGLYGSKELWQTLIDTKKKLDILQEFVMKLYLNGDITDEHLHRLKHINKREEK